ncbi:hypothetical protein SISNIDRAFT_419059 [Sistotremastrum niveocremeum HHB9708]|uniref:BTB domain-containing protein n=1 Tax=Sistotremastrum niveocremeum HHB9708 TaxID=1314777 RepID=A0A164NJF9_9AGAM|nr:hypothetical protein SISNIDRAFT_419059 [Sistotremastrum niveocremeum HHB9708]
MAETEDEVRIRGPSRHVEYYFEDGNLVLLVENHLYNLHRGILTRHSDVFSAMLSVPRPNGEPEGSSDMNPIRLESIKSPDFEKLLWILYPPIIGQHRPKTLSQWTSILGLSHLWEFRGVFQLALREIEPLASDPVDRILIARRYDVCHDWLLPAYTSLCERSDPITLDEARLLGLDVLARLAQAREAIQRMIWTRRRNTTNDFTNGGGGSNRTSLFSQVGDATFHTVNSAFAGMDRQNTGLGHTTTSSHAATDSFPLEHLVIVAGCFDLQIG